MNNKELKILFLTPYFRPYLGGIERAIEQLALHLINQPDISEISVLTTKYSFPRVPHPEWQDRELTPEGVSILRLEGFPRKPPPIYSCPLVWFSPGKIKRYLMECDPDVIHFVGDGWFWGHIWAWLYRRKKSTFIFTPSYHPLPRTKFWLKGINILISRIADAVVSLSKMENTILQKDYHVPNYKQHIIHWGANSLPTREKEPDAKQVTILCVGRLGKHKGQHWLIDTYNKASAKFTSPSRLILAGGYEGNISLLEQAAGNMGPNNQIIFTGELDDEQLSKWYARSDIFVLFSRYEAFGLVYFEAMLNRLPVLTHNVGANQELLLHGSVIVPEYNEHAAINELVTLVNNQEYRESLGEEARQYAKKHFSWDSAAQQYVHLYKSRNTSFRP
jgi:glycosyltransferase involved in cell wall biosynthesis